MGKTHKGFGNAFQQNKKRAADLSGERVEFLSDEE